MHMPGVIETKKKVGIKTASSDKSIMFMSVYIRWNDAIKSETIAYVFKKCEAEFVGDNE